MYSYKFNAKRMSKQKILLPINSNGNPDWNFMEQYMKQKEYTQISKLVEYLKKRQNHIRNLQITFKSISKNIIIKNKYQTILFNDGY